MSRLEELIAERDAIWMERKAVQDRLDIAEKALLEERFKDIPRHSEGDVILVKRKLFGKYRWWPAKVTSVHLRYTEGEFQDGTPWENKTVSYSVYLRRDDGEFCGSSQGFYDHETQRMPEAQK